MWANEVPTEPGHYWTRDITPGGYGQVEIASLSADGTWFGEYDDEWIDSTQLVGICQFGPRIPSAEELAEVIDKARKWDEWTDKAGGETFK